MQNVCLSSQLDMQGYLASHTFTACAFAYPDIPNVICSTRKLPQQADVGSLLDVNSSILQLITFRLLKSQISVCADAGT